MDPKFKLTPDQYRRIEQIEGYLKTVDHMRHLVAELESNRAAPTAVIQRICETMSRELSKMRQRALTSNVGTVADLAGSLSVMASRGMGLNVKIRGLNDGMNSLTIQLDVALKQASTPEPKRTA